MKTELEIEAKNPAINTEHQWRYLARCSSQSARDLISLNLALKYLILPIGVFELGEEKIITLLSFGELDFKSIEELRFISGGRISLEITKNKFLVKAIYAAYKGEDLSLTKLIDKSNLEVACVEASSFSANDATVPNLLDAILNRAEILSASDLHIEPYNGSFRIRYRVAGKLIQDSIAKLEKNVGKNLIRCIKVRAHLENYSGACDGKFVTTGISAKREIRVSILPLNQDEKIVLRFFGNELLSNSNGDYLGKLGLSSLQQQMLTTALKLDSGALVVAGPTGSGKSTLLYSCLLGLDLEKLNIVSIEDPVEHEIQGVSQVDLSRAQGLTYSEILPYVLRQDPDVLMLGEVRDSTTANLAFEAALTGKLILTTVHAANCIETLLRLNKLNVCSMSLAHSLRLVVSGRLILKNCNHCLLKSKLPQRFVDYFNLSAEEYSYSAGCLQCSNARIGVYEFLPITSEIKKYLSSNQLICAETVKELATTMGYRSYSLQVLDYLMQGVISLESACKSLGMAESLFDP